MSQETIERPATRRTSGKAPALPTDSREKIIWMMKDLLAGACAMVVAEEGDCLGRVMDHASSLVIDATNQFAESDSDASYHTMLEADSFIQAAAALAEREYQEKDRPRARWSESRRLADLSEAVTTAQDQQLVDIMSGKAAIAGQGEPAATVASLSAANPDDACGWLDIALETLQTRLQGLNSNAAYGVRSLMRLAKQSMEVYRSDPTNDDAYDQATMDMGIAMDTLDAFNNDDVDDLVLYAVALALEKALSCIEVIYEGGQQ